MKQLFDEICRDIESEYSKEDESKLSMENRGCRFLLSPVPASGAIFL